MTEIRNLGLADRYAWAALRHALWPHHSQSELSDELEAMIGSGLAGFGAFDGAKLAGFAEVSERAYGAGCDTAPVAWLEGIYVDPDYRRGGIGRLLVEAIVQWALARGHSELGSDVEIDNALSLMTHASWGFAETKRVVMLRRVLA